MQYFSVFLINGFLLSITPSTVTDSKCTNRLPVIKDNCKDAGKIIPLVLPETPPQNGTGDIKMEQERDEKNIAPPGCPEAKAC